MAGVFHSQIVFSALYSYDHNYDVISSLGNPRIAFIGIAALE